MRRGVRGESEGWVRYVRRTSRSWDWVSALMLQSLVKTILHFPMIGQLLPQCDALRGKTSNPALISKM